jgi:anti-sigma factor RsiW
MAMSGPTEPEPASASSSEMQCREIAELLGDYLEGTLPKHTRELLEWHIDACPPCVAFVNTYRGTVSATRSLRDVEIPPELKKRLLAVLRARPSE